MPLPGRAKEKNRAMLGDDTSAKIIKPQIDHPSLLQIMNNFEGVSFTQP
jgi:hypothetical protein